VVKLAVPLEWTYWLASTTVVLTAAPPEETYW
jgi:hypothetical protein